MSRLNPMAFLIPYDTNPSVLAKGLVRPRDDSALDL